MIQLKNVLQLHYDVGFVFFEQQKTSKLKLFSTSKNLKLCLDYSGDNPIKYL